MARHMKPINRGPASAQGYGEASPLSHKATAKQVPRVKRIFFVNADFSIINCLRYV